MSKSVVIPKLPSCDICTYGLPPSIPKVSPPRNALFDSRMRNSTSWANMCQEHYDLVGIGKLGTGYGQKLISEEEA